MINPPTSDMSHEFEYALQSVGFFWPFMNSIELIGAICLLTNRAPALGLALLMPIMAVIVLFHVFLNPLGLPLATIMLVLGGVLTISIEVISNCCYNQPMSITRSQPLNSHSFKTGYRSIANKLQHNQKEIQNGHLYISR